MDFPIAPAPGRTLDVTMRVYARTLDLGYISDAAQTFVQRDDDTGQVMSSVTITWEDWADFGSPEQITVAITAGDTLND